MPRSFRENAKHEYFKIKMVTCPAFKKELINFNAKGFNHLFYKGDRSDRDFKDIKTRTRLLSRAVKVLKFATFFQEESSYWGNYRSKEKEFKFWAFEAVVEERRIKVIVRQVGKGNKHFWSVIPAWRPARTGKKIKNYRVNPAKY